MISYFLNPILPLALGMRVILIFLAKYGINLFPQSGIFLSISLHWQNPGAAPLLIRGMPGNDYLLTNSWAALLAGMLGLSDPLGFYLSQFVLVIAALLSPFFMPSVSSSSEKTWLMVILMLVGPQSALLLNWVCGYDTLTVIGAVTAVLACSKFMSATGWVLLALNHPSLAVVAWVLWLPLQIWFFHGLVLHKRLMVVLLSLGPILIGILVNHLIVQSWGGNTSRLDWLTHWNYADYLVNYARALPLIMWSLLGLGWLVLFGTPLIKLLETKILLLTVTLAGVFLPLIAVDETRVVSLALLPVLLTYVRYVTIPNDSWLLGEGRGWFALAAILVPTVLVFSRTGNLHGWSWIWNLFKSMS